MRALNGTKAEKQGNVTPANIGGVQRHLNMVKYRHTLRMAEYAAKKQETTKKDI